VEALIKIRYKVMAEDWAEEICPFESEAKTDWVWEIQELLGSVLNKPFLEEDTVHMIMGQAIFNRLAYACALSCVNIEESKEMMKKFNMLWLGKRHIPVYLQD